MKKYVVSIKKTAVVCLETIANNQEEAMDNAVEYAKEIDFDEMKSSDIQSEQLDVAILNVEHYEMDNLEVEDDERCLNQDSCNNPCKIYCYFLEEE